MIGYHIEVISPAVVEIHEDVATYQLTKADAEAALEQIRANRARYASELCWQRRMDFYEDVLDALNRKSA